MRTVRLMGLLLLICLALVGCQASGGEVENQAYVLILGADRLEDGQLNLTARIPKVGGSGDSKESGESGGSPYLTFSASGESWPQALEALQLATPRQMNLSHIELLVVSDALAREQGFSTLIRQIVETPHLYATARLAVCEGSARAFIDAGETIIGTRLTAELRAMLSHYADMGYVPDCTLADAYFAFNSFYSDPVGIWAWSAGSKGDSSPIEGESTAALKVGETPMKQRFCGAALFKDGKWFRSLPLRQTRLLNLIRGQLGAFPFECDGKSYELTPVGRPKLRVTWQDGGVSLGLSVRLATLDDVCGEDASSMRQALQRQIEELVRSCQREACDPFGFSEAAAGHYATVSRWLECGWRAFYAGADLRVSVEIDAEGA